MTNDGTLANLVTHPRYEVEKVYLALVKGTPGSDVLRSLTAGVEIEGGFAKAVRAKVKDRHGDRTLVEVVLAEGKKRQIRLMFRELGYPVLRLARVAIGPIRDGKLEPGSWRRLTVAEVQSLYEDAGATWDDAPAIISEDDDA
jgi:23S rRNA pseudouridine2605 synthase